MRALPLFLLPLLSLTACGKGDETALEDTGPTGDEGCDVQTITTLSPPADQATVSRAGGITLGLDAEITLEDASIEVLQDGVAIAYTAALVDEGVSFTPTDGPLAAYATFSWTATVCEQTATGTFTTGQYDTPPDAASLAGATYQLDLDNATWVQPTDDGSLFSSFFSGILLLGVQASSDEEIDFLLGAGEETEIGVLQDACFETVDFDPVSFAYSPYAYLGPAELPVTVEGYAITLHDTYLSAGFAADGSVMGDGILMAQADARDMESMTGMSGAQACAMLESYMDISCSACNSDGEPYCVTLEIQDITSARVDGVTLYPITETSAECKKEASG